MNSLDVLGPCLVCGTDAEAIYVTRQLFHEDTKRFQVKHTVTTFQMPVSLQILLLENVKFAREQP